MGLDSFNCFVYNVLLFLAFVIIEFYHFLYIFSHDW